MRRVTKFHVLFVVVLVVEPLNAARILLIPGRSYSHCRLLASVGEALLDVGHDVTMYINRNIRIEKCSRSTLMQTIRFEENTKFTIKNAVDMMIDEKQEYDVTKFVWLVPKVSTDMCKAVLLDKKAWNTIKSKNYDLVVIDGLFFFHCFVLIPYKLNIPYVSVSVYYPDLVSGRPFIPALGQHALDPTYNSNSFTNRLISTFLTFVFHWYQPKSVPYDVLKIVAPELTQTEVFNLISKSRLFLENSDPLMDSIRPTTPNHVHIGGITAYHPEPLTGDIGKFYFDFSSEDIIVISFGSILDSFPGEFNEKITYCLQKLQTRAIWKTNHSSTHDNIKTVDWLPQNDLLGQNNTKLFVSHCGNMGLYEALYHGVPLLCVPFYGDQFQNARLIEQRKLGRTIDIFKSTSMEIFRTMNETLRNDIYRQNIKISSEIFHNRVDSPRSRAAFWINHVLKYGDEHLKSIINETYVYQYFNLDVYLVVFILCSIVIYACYRCTIKPTLQFINRRLFYKSKMN